MPVGHTEFGKAFPCECQREASEGQRLARLQRFSNMGLLADITFAATDPEGRAATAEAQSRFHAAFEVAQTYAQEPQGWLTIVGASGTGKTHLAAAVANLCMGQGTPVFFAMVPDLLDHLRATFSPQNELTYDELFERVKNVPLLVLDDLGVQSSTPWAQEKLFQVLNHRYVTRLPTVVTSNVPVEQMEARLQSRLGDPRVGRVADLGSTGRAAAPGIGAVEPQLRARMTFESFEAAGKATDKQGRESLAAALTVAKAFAQEPQGWLVLLGDSGCGKTHLAVSVAGQRLDAGHPVFFAFVPALLDYLRYTFGPDSRVTYDELFEEVKKTPLLILDDLGAESSTPWAHEKLYQIIVHRHNARLPTIITTRQLSDSPKDPIASRLNDPEAGVVLPISAPDYRHQARAASPSQRGRGPAPSRPGR